LPFDGSRRLTGSNLFFDSAGAVLETLAIVVDEALLTGWRRRVLRARSALSWPDAPLRIRTHADGTSLAIAAPVDQLFTATEINEWALCATLLETDPGRWSDLEGALIAAAQAAETLLAVKFAVALPVLEEQAALARFATLSNIEAAPRLRALVDEADQRSLTYVLDDDALTLGSGAGGVTSPHEELPAVAEIPWDELRAVPTAIVTGSNGKTTTVRLLAACTRAHGWRDGFNCTDGVFIAGEQILSGDYSGPVGTRTVLRDVRVQAAILETARGGILRRGLAARRAHVAIVTNVSADHFGEYGIDDLAGLADVKLVVANTLGEHGLLVLNADDALLRSRAHQLDRRIGWFSRDYNDPMLRTHRMMGGATCGMRDRRLIATWGRSFEVLPGGANDEEFDLGGIETMPITVDGTAEYNISNVAGAALAALEMGIAPNTIEAVLSAFGADPNDNPGRLMRYEYNGAQVLIDYAHNPGGLSGLLNVAVQLKRTGRLALLLGQAGNRSNADIELLALTAARFKPDFVVIKETEGYMRGREHGEVPAILRAGLLKGGMPESAIEVQPSELGAVKRVLEWARGGDVLAMPVHDLKARGETVGLLRAGQGSS
jgi:cyanophycin synthetase